MKQFPLFSMSILVALLLFKIPATAFACTHELPPVHNELMGTFVFSQVSDCSLLLTAKVEKKMLVYVLKKEGDCTLKDMMKVCGNQYLTDHFQVAINGQQTSLQQETMDVGKEYITLTYLLDLPDNRVDEVKVTGDYMFDYNDHSILSVLFDFKGPTRSFNIKNNRRTITAKF